LSARAAAGTLAAGAALLLGGCAVNSYAGVSLKAGAAEPELQHIARRAQLGDKHAQLELGIRYEEGRGVAPDIARAEALYRLAAEDSSGASSTYVPGVGGRNGRVVSVRNGPPQQGLAEAKRRLGVLWQK
jgi:TPR repeat protein